MKVLLTGLGSIGTRHARLLQQYSDEIELIAYRSGHSRSENRLGLTVFTDLQEALQTNPDIAFITNPTHKHIDTATACAKEGCHLFIEKPLSHTLDGVNELIAETDERDLITHVGSQLRFDPVLNATREKIRNRDLGDIISFRAAVGSYLPDWRPDQDYRVSYSADPDRGGGVVLDLIHEIDYTHWLFGPPTDVNSEIGFTDTLEIESEAIAEAVMKFDGGVIGNIHMDYCRRQPRRTLEVICENGTLIADIEERELISEFPDSTEIDSFDYGRDRRFENQLDYFVEHVQANKPSENDLRQAKEVLMTALKIKGEYDD